MLEVIGRDLSLENVVRAMLSNRDAWKAVRRFAETVMLSKEEAERVKQNGNMFSAPSP